MASWHVQNNLAALKQLPRVALNNIRDIPEAFTRKFYSPLNLNRLQFFIDSRRLNPKEPITIYHLWRSGALGGKIKDGVKLLGTGKTWFQANVDTEVSRASKTAIAAIERQGGKITCAHYNRLGLRVLLKPEKFEGQPIPRLARPPSDLMKCYSDPTNRGYLADPVELEKAREANRLASEVD